MWQFTESTARLYKPPAMTFPMTSYPYRQCGDNILMANTKPALYKKPLKICGFRPNRRKRVLNSQENCRGGVQPCSLRLSKSVDYSRSLKVGNLSEYSCEDGSSNGPNLDAQHNHQNSFGWNENRGGVQEPKIRPVSMRLITSTGSMTDPDSSLLSPPLSPEPYSKFSIHEVERDAYYSVKEVPQNILPSWTQTQNRFSSSFNSDEESRAPSKSTNRVTSERVEDNSLNSGSYNVSRFANAPRGNSCVSPFNKRKCISCRSKHTPCWRPSWNAALGQLCNSCGLRYRKSRVRCTSQECSYVPSKIELAQLRSTGDPDLSCPKCCARLISE